jgi:hypothetical protein
MHSARCPVTQKRSSTCSHLKIQDVTSPWRNILFSSLLLRLPKNSTFQDCSPFQKTAGGSINQLCRITRTPKLMYANVVVHWKPDHNNVCTRMYLAQHTSCINFHWQWDISQSWIVVNEQCVGHLYLHCSPYPCSPADLSTSMDVVGRADS